MLGLAPGVGCTATARSWSGPTLATRSFDCPSTSWPSRPTATRSSDVPTNAISSFVRTLTGRRATARTSESPIASPPLRARPAAPAPRPRSQTSRTVVPPTMFVISHVPSIRATSKSAAVAATILPVFNVDVVALEVQRASVAANRDLELVRRVIRDPFVLRLEGRRLLQPESPDLVDPCRGLPRDPPSSSRWARTGSSSARCPSSSWRGGSPSRSCRSPTCPGIVGTGRRTNQRPSHRTLRARPR